MPGACSLAEDCPSVYEGFRSGVRDDLTFSLLFLLSRQEAHIDL